ncbi:MAG: PLP-dependent aminotransferase family protein [Burkholderiales bacterium]|nr:PLP-dependent aminotransferase family protein [Burkholderiales bacterium]
MLAYDRLEVEGYLQLREAVGTFVSSELPESCLNTKRCDASSEKDAQEFTEPWQMCFSGRPQVIVNHKHLSYDFWLGRPDPHSFPIGTWRRIINRILVVAGTRLTEYRDPAGLIDLRKAIADYLRPTRGINVHADQVFIVAGCQEGFNLTARLLLHERNDVAIEKPAYHGAAYLYESYGAHLLPVCVDANGLVVDDLPSEGAALLYVTPSHQYPMGFTLSLERRLRLLDWARRTRTYIVEDDYDSDFRYRGSPIPALMGLDSHGCVIYLGTFSKSLGAGLRIGYVVVPSHLVDPVRTVKALLNNGHPWLEQAVLAEFIASGSYVSHLRRIRHCYAERRDCLVDNLQRHFGEVTVSGTECGMHIAWHLTEELPRAAELQAMAANRSVGIYTLQTGAACDFGGCDYSERTIVLGFSSLNERQIHDGVERIAAAVNEARGYGGPGNG